MSDSSVQRAAAQVAGLYAHGRTPTPEQETVARRGLAYQRVQREIRRSFGDSPNLDPGHAAHLVAMLVGGQDDEAVERLERSVSEAMVGIPLTDSDRMRIAQLVLGGAE